MKGIIIFKSKYGSTRQYAEWLQEGTGYDLFAAGDEPENLSSYDIVVLGCFIVIGSLTNKSWVVANWPKIQDKKIALMVISAAGDIQTCEKAMTGSLPANMLKKIHLFALPGRYIVEKLSFFDGLLIKVGSSLVKDPVAKKSMLTSMDNVKREHLQEIENYLTSLK